MSSSSSGVLGQPFIATDPHVMGSTDAFYVDPVTAKPEIRRYVIGHDCGVQINPLVVKGMTLGGIAHGLGATLLEEFVYDSEGQMMSQSLMDYLLPSSSFAVISDGKTSVPRGKRTLR